MTLALLTAFMVAVRPVPLLFRHRFAARVAREISLWRWQRQCRRRPHTAAPPSRTRRGARAFAFQAHRPASFPGPDDGGAAYVPPARATRRPAPVLWSSTPARPATTTRSPRLV